MNQTTRRLRYNPVVVPNTRFRLFEISLIGMYLMLLNTSCGKKPESQTPSPVQQTVTAREVSPTERERELDAKIFSLEAEIAQTYSAKRGIDSDTTGYRALNEKESKLSSEQGLLIAERDKILDERNQKQKQKDIVILKDFSEKLPQPDASVLSCIAEYKGRDFPARSPIERDGLRALLAQSWLGTNTSGRLVGLNRNSMLDSETGVGCQVVLGNTIDEIREGRDGHSIAMIGPPDVAVFKVSDYDDNLHNIPGALLSTNKLRICFPQKALGTVDFFPRK